jgi:hypothetical protein
MGHLSSEQLVDLAEGAANVAAARHAAGCPRCQQQVDELRVMLVSLDEAGDIPEPSPMFWDHLSARVRDAIHAEPPPRAAFWRTWAGWQPVAAAAMVILVAVVALRLPRSASSIDPPAPAPAEQAADLTPVVLDEPLSLLADLATDVDWDTAGESLGAAVGATDQAFSDLDAVERSELHRLLREALSGSGV